MKNVLITGGSRGIGRATALRCAADGWSIALNYAGNRQAADRTLEALATSAPGALAIQGDISRKTMSSPCSTAPRPS